MRRLVAESEVTSVAKLAAQAFGEDSLDARTVMGEVNVALRRALWGKRMSAAKVRQRRSEGRGGDAGGAGREGDGARRREMERLARSRQWMCLLADLDDRGATRACMGAVTVALVRCEAALPPPFPTGAAWRPYLCNMAVDLDCRRRGLATELLAAAEKLARRWGHSDLWLHSEVNNEAALGLYQGAGYEVVSQDAVWRPLLTGQRRRLLLRKAFVQDEEGETEEEEEE